MGIVDCVEARLPWRTTKDPRRAAETDIDRRRRRIWLAGPILAVRGGAKLERVRVITYRHQQS